MRVLSDDDKNANIEYLYCFGKPFEGDVKMTETFHIELKDGRPMIHIERL